MSETDRSKSLEELEGLVWDEPEFDSHLVVSCHALRKKPLSELSGDEVRMAIGQDIGRGHLMPLALERLEADPLIDVYYYKGDLLSAIAEVPAVFWEKHPDWRHRLQAIARRAITLAAGYDDGWKMNNWSGLQRKIGRIIQ